MLAITAAMGLMIRQLQVIGELRSP